MEQPRRRARRARRQGERGRKDRSNHNNNTIQYNNNKQSYEGKRKEVGLKKLVFYATCHNIYIITFCNLSIDIVLVLAWYWY